MSNAQSLFSMVKGLSLCFAACIGLGAAALGLMVLLKFDPAVLRNAYFCCAEDICTEVTLEVPAHIDPSDISLQWTCHENREPLVMDFDAGHPFLPGCKGRNPHTAFYRGQQVGLGRLWLTNSNDVF